MQPHSKGSPRKKHKIKSAYLTPTFSGVQKWVEWLRDPCILRAPKEGTTSELATSALPSQGCKWLCHPCVLGGRPQKRTKSGLASPPLPSRGPKTRQNGCEASQFLGVPTRGDKIRIGYLSLAFSGA